MRVFGIVLLVIGILLFAVCMINLIIWNDWQYPKEYEYALKLADDSSLPQDKAKYLTEYLEKIKTIKGEPRYIFKRPDLNLSKQIVILEGLINRFNDIAKIKPSEMAYQQGMQQLSGQEIDHQLGRISSIFKEAKLRESVMFYIWLNLSWILWLIIILLGWIFVGITS